MKWLDLHISGQSWPVYLVGAKSKHLEYGEYVARCFFDKRRIYISKDQPQADIEEALIHEFEHVLIRTCGAWEILDGAIGEKPAGRVDEALVMVGTPYRVRLYRDLGFVFPKLPSQ